MVQCKGELSLCRRTLSCGDLCFSEMANLRVLVRFCCCASSLLPPLVVSAPFCLLLLLCLDSTSCSEGEACWSRRCSHASCGLSFAEYIVLVGHLSPSLTFGMKEMSLWTELSCLFKSHFIPSHHSQAILSPTLRNIVCSNLWSDGRARISQLGLNFENSLGPSLFQPCCLLRGIRVPLLSKLLIDPWGRKCFFCNDMYCATSHLECCRAALLATSHFSGERDGKMTVFPGTPLTYFSSVYIKYPGVRTEWQLLYCVSCPKVDSVNTEVRQCDR